jgi:hypothetical protein
MPRISRQSPEARPLNVTVTALTRQLAGVANRDVIIERDSMRKTNTPTFRIFVTPFAVSLQVAGSSKASGIFL